MMKIYAFIFARGGSKGIPFKNIKKLNGKPLINYSIDIARKVKSINKIFVSTEDEKIKEMSKIKRVNIIDRPADLSLDDTPEWDVWRHAINHLNTKKDFFDIFISLPTTSPLRNIEDIERSLSALKENIDMVVTMSKSNRSPWFNMVKKSKNGFVSILNNDSQIYSNRQSVPTTYDLTTVAYVSRPKYILKSKGVFDGNVYGVEVPPGRSIDIDTEFDFKMTEIILKNKLELS